jgi:hypothetical protein
MVTGEVATISDGDRYLKQTNLNPKITIGPNETNEDIIFELANCVIILRSVHVKGAFCHFPEVDKVEIITRNGKERLIGKHLPSKFLSGFSLPQTFTGNRYEHPDGSPGLISSTAEGQLYGFVMINDHGQTFEIPMEKYVRSDFLVSFGKERIFLNLIDGNNPQKRHELIIYACGAFDFFE